MTGRASSPKMLTAPAKSQLTIRYCPSPVKMGSVWCKNHIIISDRVTLLHMLQEFVMLHPPRTIWRYRVLTFSKMVHLPTFTMMWELIWMKTCKNRWIGRKGTVEYPTRSPDLTPLDFFFLWSFLKDKVYSRKTWNNCWNKTRNWRRMCSNTRGNVAGHF